jgi:hypothetical protein
MVYCILDWLTSAPVVANFLTFFTLLALLWYAWDTNRMKREMLRQGKASRRPFFSVVPEQGTSKGKNEPAAIFNGGEGVAYNVQVEMVGPKWKGKRDIGAVHASGNFYIASDGHKRLTYYSLVAEVVTLVITYRDSAGTRYWSTIRASNSEEFIIQTAEGLLPAQYH